MGKNTESYNLVRKAQYELDDKIAELETAKEKHRKEMIDVTTKELLEILTKEGSLSERDLKLFLGNLSLQTKQLYSK